MVREPDETLPREVAVPLLVEEHGGRLLTLARQFCANPEEAEDLVQEVYLQAWRKWDQFEGRSSPATWLYTIASRICQRFHRKRSGEPDSLDSLETIDFASAGSLSMVPADDDPLAEQIRREGQEQIEAAISELPQDFRMPLILKEIAGFSVVEVAAILDLKEATVKTRLHRARLKLRDALDSTLPSGDAPPSTLSEAVCLDLLESKQEHLDRGLPFEFPGGVVCKRCATVFASMDFACEACADIAKGKLPPEVRETLLARMRPEG
jgi:RNA polymerase sigma-70 factor, ECF subfamily